MLRKRQQAGFTIVELLIVIVVIAILAMISVVAYSGFQGRAQAAKINSDLSQLEKAIHAARVNTGKVLKDITGSGCTACACISKSTDIDLATLDKDTDSCWTRYLASVKNIAVAAGMSLNNLIDPSGRPYYIDENELEQIAAHGPCGIGRDYISTFIPRENNTWGAYGGRHVSPLTAGC